MNNLVKINEYAVTKTGSNIGQVIEANIGPSGFSNFDLDRISIPTGGAQQWTIPTVSGDTQSKEIAGIIVHWSEKRAYWKRPMGESESTPPDCYSDDNVHGTGTPAGVCAQCALSAWGTAKCGMGKGQACKLMRVLYMVRKDDMLPISVILPPTSVSIIRKYFTRLASQGLPVYAVETKLELDKAKNDAGIAYAVVRPSMLRVVDKETLDSIKSFMDGLKSSLARMRVASDVGRNSVDA